MWERTSIAFYWENRHVCDIKSLAMQVRITKEAYEAWREFSKTDVPCQDVSADMVEIELPNEAYDEIVAGRLQGETLSSLILRKRSTTAHPCR
jgi:hypothetical protein